MWKGFKKATGLLLATTLLLAACSTGGNNQGSNQGNNQGSTNGSGSQVGQNERTEPIRFSWYYRFNDSKLISTMSEVRGMQEIMKLTNSEIQFMETTEGDLNQQFNIMLASGDFPDVIYWRTSDYPGGLSKLVDDGVALPLDDLIEAHAPNFKRLLDENPDLRRQTMLDDGTIALIPKVELDLNRMSYSGFIIRKDWLDNLGLPVPTTIDEWYTTLTAFKEQDPNGNGQADEIPITNGLLSIASFAGAFETRMDKFYIDPNTGKMTWGPVSPQYRAYLETMAKWYSEGLIDPEFASMDSKAVDARIANNLSGASRGAVSWFKKWDDLMLKDNPDFKIVAVPFPVGPAGKPYGVEDVLIQNASSEGAFITSSAENPEEIIKVLDFMFSPEGHNLINWGIEGESYEVVDGKNQYTDAILNNAEGHTPGDYIRLYAYPTNGFPKVMDVEAYRQIQLRTPEGLDALKTWFQVDTSLLLPELSLGEDSQRYAQIMSEVNTYFNEFLIKFVMGIEPMDKFDNFVATLKRLGIDEAIAIQQAAYDRYQAR